MKLAPADNKNVVYRNFVRYLLGLLFLLTLWGCMVSTPYKESRRYPVSRDTVQSLQKNSSYDRSISGIWCKLNPRSSSLPAKVEGRHNAGVFQFVPYQTGGGGGGSYKSRKGYGSRCRLTLIWWTGVQFPPAPLQLKGG